LFVQFDPSIAASGQSKIIPLTIAVFLKYPEDPFILNIVYELVRVLAGTPACVQSLQEKFIPTIVSILSLPANAAKSTNQDAALDVLSTIVRYSKGPLTDILIQNAFPALIDCVLRSDDHSIMVSGGECLRCFITASPEQVYNFKNGEGLNYVMQVTTMLLNPTHNEMSAGQIGRLVIAIIHKMGNVMGENVDHILKAVISKLQLVECLRVVMSLVAVFAYLFLTQLDAVMNFLSTVPGPNGEPAMQFLFHHWLSKQNVFYGTYERKVTTMALCKIFEYGVTTQDSRLTSISYKETIIKDDDSPIKMRTRSQTKALVSEVVEIPALVKIFKLLINELIHSKETGLDFEPETGGEEDANDDDSDSAERIQYLSSLRFSEEEEDIDKQEDEELIRELLQNPLCQTNMDENLTTFIQNFSANEHFNMFLPHLNKVEKNALKQINVKCD